MTTFLYIWKYDARNLICTETHAETNTFRINMYCTHFCGWRKPNRRIRLPGYPRRCIWISSFNLALFLSESTHSATMSVLGLSSGVVPCIVVISMWRTVRRQTKRGYSTRMPILPVAAAVKDTSATTAFIKLDLNEQSFFKILSVNTPRLSNENINSLLHSIPWMGHGKQCRPRSDAVKCSVWSWYVRLHTGNSSKKQIKRKNEKLTRPVCKKSLSHPPDYRVFTLLRNTV